MSSFPSMVIWRDTPVIIKHKVYHARRHGKKWRVAKSFILDNGDVPIGVFNPITNRFEETVNIRGYAYACRKRFKYRKKAK